MKRVSIVLGLITLTACADTAPTLQTHRQALEPVKITEFTPLDRTGCEKLNVTRTQPLSMYFEAIAAEPINVKLAKEAIGRLHRQLYCMSAKDYVTNYNMIVPYLEAQAKSHQYASVVAPIVHIVSESGAKYIDTRTQRLMAQLTPSLLQEQVNSKPVAHGIGLQFKRGLSAVDMNATQLDMLLSSTTTYSYKRSQCTFNQAVFFKFNGGSGKLAYVCLNDDCPIFDDNINNIDTSSADAYAKYCKIQRDKLDGLKNSGTANGTGSGSNNGTGGAPSYATTRDGLSKCANQYTHPGQYACFVESAIGNRALDSFTNVIQTKFDLETRPKGCGSTTSSGAGSYETGLLRIVENLESIQKRLNELATLSALHANENDAKTLCEGDQTCDPDTKAVELALDIVAEDENEFTQIYEDFLDTVKGLDEKQKQQATQALLKQLRQRLILDYYNTKKERDQYQQGAHDKALSKVRHCVEDQNCSDTCDIQAHIDLYKNTSNCMGLHDGQVTLNDNTPQPDPTVMYPSPDQVHASDHAIALANCVGAVTGAAPITSSGPTGQHCGATVLCTDGTQTTSDGPSTCSCKLQSSMPEKFRQNGWEIVSACNSTIQCSANATSCSCNGLLNVFNPPPQHGGLPADPSIMLMVNYD